MITPLPTDVIVPILTNRPIIQPYMPTKIRPSPLSATTKAYQDFLIIIINHSTPVSSQTPPPYNPNNANRTTRPIRNNDLDERRAKGLCFWCDEKFIPGHKCQNKKLYSLCVVEEDGEGSEEDGVTKVDHDTHNPHIPLNALGVIGLNTLRVTSRVEKQQLFILVDSGSTHNFINNQVADMLCCKLTSIKALIVQVVDGETMTCISVCNNFQWSMQGVDFAADVFTLDLKNYDMILGIQ
jgi:hypothetical protein